MMKELELCSLSKVFEDLREYANLINQESLFGISYKGNLSSEVIEILVDLKEFVINSNFNDVIHLNIDDIEEDWADVSFEGSTIWSISIGDKESLLKVTGSIPGDTKELLFFDKKYFEDEWLEKASGISDPIAKGDLTCSNPHKIFVYGLEFSFGGPRIAVIPLDKMKQELPSPEWLKSTKLPDWTKIHKTVHFISSDANEFSPEKFLITWGDIDCDLAKKFHVASAKVLLCTLVQEYYNDKKVLLHGKKRLEVKISSIGENIDFINKKTIDNVKQVVEWCYAEDDESTRILLVIDRLSLDIDPEKSLLHVIPEVINKAYIEAKSRYKYVVLDRKAEYTKELSDLQKDIVGISDKYVSSTNDYTSGFLKDIIAFAFVLSVGVIAKKLINEKLLFSEEAGLLFKAFAVYLLISFALRFWHFVVVVVQSEKLAISWKDIVRNHMSSEELRNHVNTSLKGVKINFSLIIFVVSVMYLCMALMSWNSAYTLKLITDTNSTTASIQLKTQNIEINKDVNNSDINFTGQTGKQA